MQMDSRVILGGQQPDIVNALARGQQAGLAARESNVNRQYGGAAMQGDQNALAKLASVNPLMAQGMAASQQNMQMDREQMQLAREQGRLQALEFASQLDANQRAQAAEELKATLSGGITAWQMARQQGNPALFEQWRAQSGLEGEEFSFEYFPVAAAQAGGEVEGLLESMKPDQFDSDRFRVVGSTLFDLGADGGPAPVGQGQMQEETVFGADGKPILTRGAPGTAAKFTESQSKDNVYVTRATGALELLDSVGADALASRSERALDVVPMGIGREFQTDNFQVAQQAGDEFLQAILRKDTGAAITEGEQVLYGRTYLPQSGDGPAVLEAKRGSRIRAIEAIRAGMNPQQIVVTERAVIDAARKAEETRKSDAPTAVSEGGTTDFSSMSRDEILNMSIESLTPDQYDDYEKALQEFLK